MNFDALNLEENYQEINNLISDSEVGSYGVLGFRIQFFIETSLRPSFQ